LETGRGQNAERGAAPERAREDGYLRIGSFEMPNHVPDYEILEEKADGRDGARAVRLLIDTRAREEEEFVLIARDLKGSLLRLRCRLGPVHRHRRRALL
jgi:hypothetical protein